VKRVLKPHKDKAITQFQIPEAAIPIAAFAFSGRKNNGS
jgi:hypothetical protein